MIIVYQSKTGFTRRYADMLAAKTGLKAVRVSELRQVDKNDEIIFLGWMKVGKIQGLNKVKSLKVIAICGSGTGRVVEPDFDTIVERNQIKDTPFFYLRGGCYPLKQVKGMDKIMLSMFVKMLKRRQASGEDLQESIDIIENGFDGVEEKNLTPLLEWLKTR